MYKKTKTYFIFAGVVLLFTVMFGVSASAAIQSEKIRTADNTFITADDSVGVKTCSHELICRNDRIEPTCTQKGYIGGAVCLNCETVLENPTIIPAKGHTEKLLFTYVTNGTSHVRVSYKVCADCGKQLTSPKLSKTQGEIGHTATAFPDVERCTDVDFIADDDSVSIRPSASIIDFIINIFRKLFG